MRRLLGLLVAAFSASVTMILASAIASADDGWVAVANSPNHESKDWGYGPDYGTAVADALAGCARNQRADDCRVLAYGTDCIGTAWDVSEPLNQLFAVSGGGPGVVRQAAMAAAGPYANDVEVRCTWWPH